MSLFTYYHEAETEIFEPVFKKTMSDSARAKISALKKGKHVTEYQRQRISEANANRTPEQKKAIALKGWETKRLNGNTMIGSNNHRYGKPVSAETRAKISASNMGRTASAETRAKISASNNLYTYHTPIGIFSSPHEGAKHFGITREGLIYRCTSKSKKNEKFFREKLDKHNESV